MRKYNKRKNILISKYNLSFRNSNGIYQKKEWTSYFDIGKIFNDGLLQRKEYEQVENLYIEAVFLILNYFNSKGIKIKHLYNISNKEDFIKNNDIDLYETYLTLQKEKFIIEKKMISNIIKLKLREYIGELELLVESKSRSEIIFGFDYNIYLKTNMNVEPLLYQINEIGLFTG